jgi:hypothetical protein
MTIPISTIKTTLQSWLVTASGLASGNVIFAYQNAPEPSGKYITIIPALLVQKLGLIDDQQWSDGKIQTYAVRRITAQIDCYGAGAVETLSAVQDFIDRPATYTACDNVKLSMRALSDVRYIPELKGQRWEDRASLDLSLLCATGQTVLDDVGYFDRIQYEGDGAAPVGSIELQTIEET